MLLDNILQGLLEQEKLCFNRFLINVLGQFGLYLFEAFLHIKLIESFIAITFPYPCFSDHKLLDRFLHLVPNPIHYISPYRLLFDPQIYFAVVGNNSFPQVLQVSDPVLGVVMAHAGLSHPDDAG